MRASERTWLRLWPMLAAIAVLALVPASARAQQVTIRATLIRASDAPGETDERLKSFEPNLRRIFGFQSYELYGDGSAAGDGSATVGIDLGHGNSLDIHLAPADEGKVEAGINWQGPGGPVLNTTVVMSRGVPIILGGGQQDGGTLIIAVTAE